MAGVGAERSGLVGGDDLLAGHGANGESAGAEAFGARAELRGGAANGGAQGGGDGGHDDAVACDTMDSARAIVAFFGPRGAKSGSHSVRTSPADRAPTYVMRRATPPRTRTPWTRRVTRATRRKHVKLGLATVDLVDARARAE